MATVPPPIAPTSSSSVPMATGTTILVAATRSSAALLNQMPANAPPFEAVLIERAPNGTIRLALADGQSLDLKGVPPVPAPRGATLSLQLQPQGEGVALRVTAVNGRPVGPAAVPSGPPPDGETVLPLPSVGGGPPSVSVTGGGRGALLSAAFAPEGLTATMLRPAAVTPGAAAPSVPAALATLAPGSQVTVRLAGVVPAGGGPGPATAGPEVSSPPGPVPPSGPALGAPPTGGGTSALLSGRVMSVSAAGGGVIETPIGVLSLSPGPGLAVGDRVMLELVRPAAGAADALPARPSPGGWGVLTDVLQVLGKADPLAAETMVRALPQDGPRLAAAMVSLVTSLRAGDGRPPGGDAPLRGLERIGRRDLADLLRGEMAEAGKDAGRARGPGGDWQMLTLPFLHNERVEPVRLFLRRLGDEDGASGARGAERRFILDVELSQLGRMQFDGLVQRPSKRFDLIIRTADPLEVAVRREIAGIFAEAGHLTGFVGEIGFQSGRGFVELPPTAAPTSLLA